MSLFNGLLKHTTIHLALVEQWSLLAAGPAISCALVVPVPSSGTSLVGGVTVTTVCHLPAPGDFQPQRFCRSQMWYGKQDDVF